MRQIFTLFILLTTLTDCSPQTSNELTIKDIEFNNLWVGLRKGTGRQFLYSMLSHSSFRPYMSTGTKTFIENWYQTHPNARVVEVYCYKTIKESEMSGFIYCWIIDGKDTLNNILIREGNFPVNHMTTPRLYDGTNDDEFVYAPGIPEINYLVDKKEYELWQERIIELEKKAQQEKIGLWKNKQKN